MGCGHFIPHVNLSESQCDDYRYQAITLIDLGNGILSVMVIYRHLPIITGNPYIGDSSRGGHVIIKMGVP